MRLYYDQLIGILLCGLLSFWIIRWYLWGIKIYPLNPSARKKRKKGETIREWFFYTRYRQEIPKFFLGLYFVVLIVNVAAILAWIVQHFMGPYPDVGYLIFLCLAAFDGAWMFLLRLMFWSRDGSMPYERWAPKKRGMRPKRKK
ncbi:MAG: hypothetical protein ACLUVP_07495 [Acutalibacter sp.]